MMSRAASTPEAPAGAPNGLLSSIGVPLKVSPSCSVLASLAMTVKLRVVLSGPVKVVMALFPSVS